MPGVWLVAVGLALTLAGLPPAASACTASVGGSCRGGSCLVNAQGFCTGDCAVNVAGACAGSCAANVTGTCSGACNIVAGAVCDETGACTVTAAFGSCAARCTVNLAGPCRQNATVVVAGLPLL